MGSLTVSNCVVSGNSGGGIFNRYGVLTVIHCDVSGNSYGIYNDHGEASVSNCIVSSNHIRRRLQQWRGRRPK